MHRRLSLETKALASLQIATTYRRNRREQKMMLVRSRKMQTLMRVFECLKSDYMAKMTHKISFIPFKRRLDLK